MKRFIKLTPIIFTILLSSCFNDYDDNLHIENDNILEEELSPNDPKETGVTFGCSITEIPLTYSATSINQNLPDSYDLSPFMPPVRSQGTQGSCVGWATAYYLKSYQEKIQHGFEYNSFRKVMSPAYIYNQIKVSSDCSLGSCIESALYELKTQGVCSWESFPYNDNNCTILPNNSQKSEASNNKILQGYKFDNETIINNISYSQEEIFKDLLYQKIPIIIAMDLDQNFSIATPRNQDNIYIYQNYDPTQFKGKHAMLIVGYNNNLNAFKVVNSWGSQWGNNGYCWISYNFFKKITDPNFQQGLISSYMAYDI